MRIVVPLALCVLLLVLLAGAVWYDHHTTLGVFDDYFLDHPNVVPRAHHRCCCCRFRRPPKRSDSPKSPKKKPSLKRSDTLKVAFYRKIDPFALLSELAELLFGGGAPQEMLDSGVDGVVELRRIINEFYVTNLNLLM